MADQPEEAAKAKPKSRQLRILVAGLIFLVAGGVTFLAFSYIKGKYAPGARASGQAAATTKTGSRTEFDEPKSVLLLDPFLVNLADKDQVRYVKASFQLGLEDPANEAAKSPAALAAIRDAIISILTAKTSDQILTPEGKGILRQEICKRVNEVAPKAKVRSVFIVDFVVQL